MRIHDPLEEKKRKKKWWMPLFGLLIAVVLAVFSLAIVPVLRDVWWNLAPNLRSANKLLFQLSDAIWWGTVDLGLAFVIWLILFSLVITVALMAVGADPAEKEAKRMAREAFDKKMAQRRKKQHRG